MKEQFIQLPLTTRSGEQISPVEKLLPKAEVMLPGVPYELMGVTGLEKKIFEADTENPIMGHEDRGNGIDYEKII